MQSFSIKILVVLCLVLLLHAVAAQGSLDVAAEDVSDTVIVNGQILKGRIRLLDSKGITFDTAYGEGKIKIDYQDIEQMSSQRPFRVYYDEDQVVLGQIMGFEKGLLSISMDRESIVSIQTASRNVILSSRKKFRKNFSPCSKSLGSFWDCPMVTHFALPII